jgi:hypothetical protein
LTGDAAGDVALWQLTGDDLRPVSSPARHHAAPITAVALAHDHRGLVAVTGDRSGTLVLTPIGGTVPLRRVMLGSTILAVAPMDDGHILVWCRRGALTMAWT